MGRPAFKPTPESRRQVEAYAAYGLPQEDICALIINPQTGKPITLKTLHQHFRAELDTGMMKANARVAESLFFQAVGRPAQYDVNGKIVRGEQAPTVAAAIFWMKARAGWSERNVHELTGRNGGPIQTMDMTKLTDDQLAALETIFGPIAASGGDAGFNPS